MRDIRSLEFGNGEVLTVHQEKSHLVLGGIAVPWAEIPELSERLTELWKARRAPKRKSPIKRSTQLRFVQKVTPRQGTKVRKVADVLPVVFKGHESLTRGDVVAAVAKTTKFTNPVANYLISSLIHDFKALEVAQ